MLILTRNVGEAIIVHDDIKIIVLQVNGNQVRISVDVPKNVIVDREEIHRRRTQSHPDIKANQVEEVE